MGIISIVRWTLRVVIFGDELLVTLIILKFMGFEQENKTSSSTFEGRQMLMRRVWCKGKRDWHIQEYWQILSLV